jgi:hypothetical protein
MAAGIGPSDRSASSSITPAEKARSPGSKGLLRLETGRTTEVVVLSTPKALGGAGASAGTPSPFSTTAESVRSFFSSISLFSPRKGSTASDGSPSLSSRVSTPSSMPLSPTERDLESIQVDVAVLPSTQKNQADYERRLGEFFSEKGLQHVQPLEIDGIVGTASLLSDEKMIDQIAKDLNRDASITLLGVTLPTRSSNGGEKLTKEQVRDAIDDTLRSQGVELSPEMKTRLLNGMQQGVLSPASIISHAMLDQNFLELEGGPASSDKLEKDVQMSLIAAIKGTEFLADLKAPTIRDTMKPFSIDVTKRGTKLEIEAKKEAYTTAKIDGEEIVFDYGVKVDVESGHAAVFLKRTSE